MHLKSVNYTGGGKSAYDTQGSTINTLAATKMPRFSSSSSSESSVWTSSNRHLALDSTERDNKSPEFTVIEQSTFRKSLRPAGNENEEIEALQSRSIGENFHLIESTGEKYGTTTHSMEDHSALSFEKGSFRMMSGNSELDKHDKAILMEKSVIRLVEASAIEAESEQFELALEHAKRAQQIFNSLKTFLSQDQQPSTYGGDRLDRKQDDRLGTSPMTTEVSLFELAVMVKSNLAAQYNSSGRLDEALELYVQLCNLASGNTARPGSIMLSSTNNNQLQVGARYLLYRFGLNIGNIYHKKTEYQQALKYYRLTLDRLSSSGNDNLRIKLMNNISVTLIALSNESKSAQPNDIVISSWNLLLADNLSQHQPNSASSNRTTNSGERRIHVFNSNHHKFGLNLMACLYQRNDLRSMKEALQSLVKVDICHQYDCTSDPDEALHVSERVISRSKHVEQEDLNQGVTHAHRQDRIVDRVKKFGHVASGDYLSSAELKNRSLLQAHGNQLGQDELIQYRRQALADHALREHPMPDFLQLSQPAGARQNQSLSLIDETNNELKMSGIAHSQEVTASAGRQQMVKVNRLDELICAKESEIYRSLIMSCNLILSLDNRLAAGDGRKPLNGEQKSKAAAVQTSALEYCTKLLTASDSFKSLVCDLKTNNVARLIRTKGKLNEAIILFEEIQFEQQVALESNQRARQRLGSSWTTGIDKHSTSKQAICRPSSIVLTNLSLLCLLKKQTGKAIDLVKEALSIDRFNVEGWINLASGYYLIKEYKLAEETYEKVLSLRSAPTRVNYNLALLNKQSGLHIDKLPPSTRHFLINASKQGFDRPDSWQKMLSTMQLLSIYQQSGITQQSITLADKLLQVTKHPPEILILMSKLLGEDDHAPSSSQSADLVSALAVMNQTNRAHPYHLPAAERLVALLISEFDYTNAQVILRDCINNRPDQVKWFHLLAECHRSATEFDHAFRVYKLAADLFPSDTSCIRALIKLSEELGLAELKATYQIRLENALGHRGEPPL